MMFLFSGIKVLLVFFVWPVSSGKFQDVILIALGSINSSIGNSISDAIKRSRHISLTKNIAFPERNFETTIVATKFEIGHVKNTCVWPEYGHFKQQFCDFHL